MQQGGNPSPFDRSLATRLATLAIEHLESTGKTGSAACIALGLQGGHAIINQIEDLPRVMDLRYFRPRQQWWMDLEKVSDALL